MDISNGSPEKVLDPLQSIKHIDARRTKRPRQSQGDAEGEAEEDCAGPEEDCAGPVVLSRPYQIEMLEQSLERNTIVVMDTGSGKTHVAVLRIKAELEGSNADKIVWFLAPTVALCYQQHSAIRLQLPSASVKLLAGDTLVDSWTARVWEAVLKDVRIVVSTYQILLDALGHAFVRIDQLSLIVFDEAHNCVGKHPGSKIMRYHYHGNKALGLEVPAILGITATPSMTEDLKNIEDLESILDAKCATPTLQRSQLLRCVNRPRISTIPYRPSAGVRLTESMRCLQEKFRSLDITQDPYILKLQRDPTDRNRRALDRAIAKHETFVQNQIKGLWTRCVEVNLQLGAWAADRYIWKAVGALLARASKQIASGWEDEERQYLADFLRQLSLQEPSPVPRTSQDISDKSRTLLAHLASVDEPTVCIIFARDRAVVTTLCHLLASCPGIMTKYRIGYMVGSSEYARRKNNLYEPLDGRDQMALQDFRSGKINILVATSVLEEGIDVPACNTVICFDQPQTPKAFIQRRGRARMKESRLILFTDAASSETKKWEQLEEDMNAICQDKEREIVQFQQLEDSEETPLTSLVVPSTGARLDFEGAKSHLEHFCKVISAQELIDNRPDYIIHRHWDSEQPTLSATVILPSVVPAHLRHTSSKEKWLSEKNATKDAALQAYRGLYDAGLVNEHLLPLAADDLRIYGAHPKDTRASIINVEAVYDPWFDLCRSWGEGAAQLWLYSMVIQDDDNAETNFSIVLPHELSQWQTMRLYLTDSGIGHIHCLSHRPISATEAGALPDHTSTLLAFHFSARWPVRDERHVVKISVSDSHLTRKAIGARSFDPDEVGAHKATYLIRDEWNHPHLYLGLLQSKPSRDQVQRTQRGFDKAPEDVPYVIATRWTKRSDFFHPCGQTPKPPQASQKTYPSVIPLPSTRVDHVPLRFTKLGMLIPCLLHEIEMMMIEKRLSTSILANVGMTNLSLVREAIQSPHFCKDVNYDRLEFLGDSVLKCCTSIHVMAMHPTWPEGYMALLKDRILSNSRLSRAALESGLDRFILTKSFTGQKWRPLYLANYADEAATTPTPREMSTKTLADVVEALIGAAYVEGGMSKARACLSVFLRDVRWRDMQENRAIMFERAQEGSRLSQELIVLEEMIGYSFLKKSLLIEAMTHASCVQNRGGRSYEQLEFIGDALLDFLVVRKTFAISPPLPYHRLHYLKTAMANADFLAFIVMSHQKRRFETTVTPELQLVESEAAPLSLWQFMRHSSEPVAAEQAGTLARFEGLRQDISAAFETGDQYPWALLARLQARKFMSDIFESLLAAVWIDSGSLETCDMVLERFGLSAHLDQVIERDMEIRHPKNLLGICAGSETVRYNTDTEASKDGERRYTCRVTVGQRVVVEVGDGVSREEVTTRAADTAVRIMRSEQVGRA